MGWLCIFNVCPSEEIGHDATDYTYFVDVTYHLYYFSVTLFVRQRWCVIISKTFLVYKEYSTIILLFNIIYCIPPF